jgi:hypothetical protein
LGLIIFSIKMKMSEMTVNEIEQIVKQLNSSRHKGLVDKLTHSAIRYARIRVDWMLLPVEQRMELEEERTIAHNAFISSCDILARNMAKQGEDYSWRKLIGTDRKEIGDFACWIHLIMGLKAR